MLYYLILLRLLQIPIATLKAVSALVKTTEPLIQQTSEQRAEARKARTELLKARAADRQTRNDARALRRGDKSRKIITHYVDAAPAVAVEIKDKQ